MTLEPSRTRLTCVGTILPVLLLSGCTMTPSAPAAPETVAMTCNMPVVSALAETKEYQVKGDIGISVAATTFECKSSTQTAEREIAPGPLDSLYLPANPSGTWANYMKTETVTSPVLKVSPQRLMFKVKINNQGARVFRGTGTVVLYNVSGKNISVKQTDYDGLTNIIVPPRSEAEVDIYGPEFEQLGQAKTTMALSLYDVATKTDAAGAITQKQNFEWLYNYSVEPKQDVGTVIRKTQIKARAR
jgi:hypothetical protein